MNMRLKLLANVYCVVMMLAMTTTSISCSRKDPNIPKVDAAVRLFNGRFNAGRFHEIYANADPRFKQSVSEEELATKLTGLLQEHGPIQSSGMNGFESMTRWQRMFPESKPTRFIGVYNHCRSEGFQELFTFDVTGDEAKLLAFETSIEDANRKLLH
jgi:hypothetical protein